MSSATLTRPGLGRLTRVELRKTVDTRAGFWLAFAVGALTLLVVILTAALGKDSDRAFASMLGGAVQPSALLLPVVGILLVTSEWSQRTTLTTFVLVPQRWRVIVAKVLAAVALSVAAYVACLVPSAIATAASGGAWDLSVGLAAQMLVYLVISVLGGVAFGAALLASAPAIVLSFLLPIAWSIVSSVVSWLDDAGRWLDAARTYDPLTDHLLSATEWARVGTTTAVWVVVPLAIGVRRIVRGEISSG